MAEVAPNLAAPGLEERQEFWKPVTAARPNRAVCRHCSDNLIAGSRFCPHCGTDSQAGDADEAQRPAPAWLDAGASRVLSGRTLASRAALVLGSACILAATLVGSLYKAKTLLDWQAVQLWRIEWLLAAIAIFLAGILLKKK